MKRVYISADYAEKDGDREVVDELTKWGSDDKHKVEFIDLAGVASGSVSNNPDCRICDLKDEFNRQINASSTIIFVVGNKTKSRTAGSTCQRNSSGQDWCSCTPYKGNANGRSSCKVSSTFPAGDDVGNINNYSYLQHEFEQAKKKGKHIIIVYNSTRYENDWLPAYMSDFRYKAQPFWIISNGVKWGNYEFIKKELGF